MTSERLQRLRAWVEQAAGKEVAFVYSDGILRLLDEREALLAERDIFWTAAITRFWCHCGCDQSLVRTLPGGIHTAPGCDSCAPLLKLLARGHDET